MQGAPIPEAPAGFHPASLGERGAAVVSAMLKKGQRRARGSGNRAGGRRRDGPAGRAARAAGLSEVPCLIMSASEADSSAIALVENLQRRDLDFFEEAAGYRQLIDRYGLTQEEAARKVGKTQSAVANKLRLLKLSPENMRMIRDGGLSERHARAILRLPGEQERLRATAQIIEHQWNVSRTEQYIDRLLSDPPEKPAGTMRRLIKDVRLFLNTVDKAVGMMKESGVNTSYEKEEREDGILVKILIPHARR